MNRRSFLQRLGCTALGLPSALGLSGMNAYAQSLGHTPFLRENSQSSDRILVIIRLMGGNDGLNTVIPYNNDLYYAARGRGTVNDLSIAAESTLRLPDSGTMGLHPSLSPLHTLYKEGKVAVVQNVGYPGQSLSHFRSSDIWLSGSDADVFDATGWYARYLEEQHPDYPSLLPEDPFAIELGTTLGATLIGARNNMGIAMTEIDYIPGLPRKGKMETTYQGMQEEYVREIVRQTHMFSHSIDAALKRQPSNHFNYDAGMLVQKQLSMVARMIASGLNTQLYIINIDGYDYHTNQAPRHASQHTYFADGLYAFQRDLEAFGLDERVSMMTISEFGRRVAADGHGTDHGAASMLFVIGSKVNGGLIGSDPDLADLDEAGNLKMKIDFRQVYASVLAQWLGASANDIYRHALPRTFEQLPIFDNVALDSPPPIVHTPQLGQSVPNPASDRVTIQCEGISEGELVVSASDGQRVYSEPVRAGQREIRLDVSGYASGSYTYELVTGGSRFAGRMIVQR